MAAGFLSRLFGKAESEPTQDAREPDRTPVATWWTQPPPLPMPQDDALDLMTLAEYSAEERATALEEVVVGNAAARELARAGAARMVDNLHPFPAVASQVFAVLQNPRAGAPEIAAVVNRDPAMAAAILKLASSSFYAGDRPISTVRDAIVRLGLTEVGSIAASVAASALFDRKVRTARAGYSDEFSALWYHSITTAFAASTVAMERGLCDPNQAFLAALLHDIGKTVTLEGIALESAARAQAQHHEDSEWLGPAELSVVIEDLHTEVGIDAVKRWHLPEYLCDTVQFIHALDVPKSPQSRLVHTIRVISGLNMIRTRPAHIEGVHTEVRSSATALGLPDRALYDFGNVIRNSAAKAQAIRNNTN
jgi:putative nucleotidyltransferase with HDIG domain